MKDTELQHRISPHHPLLRQIKQATVCLKTLLLIGKSLVLYLGKTYPSQLRRYHTIQTKQ